MTSNIYIQNVRPNTVNPQATKAAGAYVYYSANFPDKGHTVNGNFSASDDEIKQAEANTNGDVWNGFKLLVAKRLSTDTKGLAVTNPSDNAK